MTHAIDALFDCTKRSDCNAGMHWAECLSNRPKWEQSSRRLHDTYTSTVDGAAAAERARALATGDYLEPL